MSNTKIVIESFSSIELDQSGLIESETLDKTVTQFLLNKKDRKLMSKQDKLALISATTAWNQFTKKQNLDMKFIADQVGIYFCVGILPFEDKPLEKIAQNSQEAGKFNTKKFSNDCYNSMNPLLTFKCLPNMPLFHISYNLGITGPYVMTYPGHQDLFESIERAVDELQDGQIDYAIVGASCDQKNILVEHHHERCQKDLSKLTVDCSSTIILSKRVLKKGDYYIDNMSSQFLAIDPFKDKSLVHENVDASFYGPAQILFDVTKKIKKNEENILSSWSQNQSTTSLEIRRFS